MVNFEFTDTIFLCPFLTVGSFCEVLYVIRELKDTRF